MVTSVKHVDETDDSRRCEVKKKKKTLSFLTEEDTFTIKKKNATCNMAYECNV